MSDQSEVEHRCLHLLDFLLPLKCLSNYLAQAVLQLFVAYRIRIRFPASARFDKAGTNFITFGQSQLRLILLTDVNQCNCQYEVCGCIVGLTPYGLARALVGNAVIANV